MDLRLPAERGDSQCERQRYTLETTMFNYYFDADRDAHADTVTLFEECAEGKFVPFTSDYVVQELESAPESKRKKMWNLSNATTSSATSSATGRLK
jgi:predicted nucleic acid-binding protein